MSTAEPPAAVLETRGLTISLAYRGGPVNVVRDVSLSIREGELLALVGESGCGKTLTALSLLRLLPSPPASIAGGEIWLDGEEISRATLRHMRDLRGQKISMIFQEPLTSLDPVFTIGQQLVEAVRTHGRATRKEAEEMAVEMLREVQIPSPERRMHEYPHQLSGGMRQRVMIAIALILAPKVLIADEPTTALDVTIQAEILDLLRAEQQRRRLSVLLITHDLAVVSQVADRIAVMYAGEIVEHGPAEDILTRPRHPYTQGLLRAVPQLEDDRERLAEIAGTVPDPRVLPPACPFAPRCPHEILRCWQEHPQLVRDEGERLLRCWNPQPFDNLEPAEAARGDAPHETGLEWT